MLAIYTRLSREDDDSNSIDNQIREGKKFTKKLKLKEKIYNEGMGISGGADIADRPELLNLINDMKDGTITHVWMRSQDRLARNTFTYAYFLKIAEDNNTKVYFGDKEFDYKDPMVKIMGSIISGFDEYKKTTQSIGTIKSIKDNFNEGKFHGIPPYGYQLDDNRHIIINDEEADVVREIYQLSLDGNGQRKIAEILNKKGIPTRYNLIGEGTITTKNKYTKKKTTRKKTEVTWAGNTVRGIITNPHYKGEKKTKHGTFEVPAILTPEYWQEVNDNLKANRNNSGSSKPKYNYLLKGLIRCGKCGRNYYGRTRESKKDHYYMCSSKRYKELNCGNRSINIDRIEDLIWGDLIQRDGLKKIIEGYFNQNQDNGKINELEQEIRELKSQLTSLENQRIKITRLTLKDVLTESEGEMELLRIRREKKSTENRLNNLGQELTFLKQDETLDEFGQSLEGIKNNAPFESKRELLHKHIQHIYINSDDENMIYSIVIRFKLIHNTFAYWVDYDWKGVERVLDIEGIIKLKESMALSPKQQAELYKFKEDYEIAKKWMEEDWTEEALEIVRNLIKEKNKK